MKTKLLFVRTLSLWRLGNICAHVFSAKIDWKRLLWEWKEVDSLMKQGIMLEVTISMPYYFSVHSYKTWYDSYRVLSQ